MAVIKYDSHGKPHAKSDKRLSYENLVKPNRRSSEQVAVR